MAALLISVVVNVRGEDIPLKDISPDLKRAVWTKLNNDAMYTAGYEKAPQKQQLHKEHT